MILATAIGCFIAPALATDVADPATVGPLPAMLTIVIDPGATILAGGITDLSFTDGTDTFVVFIGGVEGGLFPSTFETTYMIPGGVTQVTLTATATDVGRIEIGEAAFEGELGIDLDQSDDDFDEFMRFF
jgi:hypothetical protein